MATATLEIAAPRGKRASSSPGRPLLFSVEQYHAIQDTRALPELGRFELLRGQILEKEVPKPPHVKATRKLRERLDTVLCETGFSIRVQNPIVLRDSEPQPDLAIVIKPLDRVR